MSTPQGREAIRKAIELGAPNTAQARDRQEFRRCSVALLTPEQRAHMQANGQVNRQAWIKAHPARESTGLMPLPLDFLAYSAARIDSA